MMWEILEDIGLDIQFAEFNFTQLSLERAKILLFLDKVDIHSHSNRDRQELEYFTNITML